ncbi:hypothetical protein JYT44_02425 [Caldithrix abyssi]|nr:hypothetical protein [Caldithrix abyssi]
MNSTTELQSIWEYIVPNEYLTDFIKTYSPDGDWVKLFQQCQGYIKTELIRDIYQPDRFITIDFWQSHNAFSAMKETIGDEYKKLDKHCEAFTSSENHLGFFGRP